MRGISRRSVVVVLVAAIVAAACTSGETSTTLPSNPASTAPAGSSPVPPPPSIPMAVTLSGSALGGTVEEHFDVSLSSDIISQEPIVRLELWDAGGLVESVEIAPAVAVVHHLWSWPAEGVGSHVFVMRAIDREGRTGESRPLWIHVAAPAGQAGPAISGASRGKVVAAATAGIPAIAVPASFVVAATAAPDRAPLVELSPGGCTAMVTVAPALAPADGIALYGAADSAASFTLLGTFPPSGGGVSVEIPGGFSVFHTDAYGPDGTELSALIPVVADPSCTTDKWSGGATLAGGFLASDAPVDRAYLYLSAGNGPWARYPASGFAPRSTDGFDFSPVLPSIGADGAMTFEAWGRGDAGLVFLGAGTFGGAKASASVSLVGTATFTGPLHPSLVWVKQPGKNETSGEFGQAIPEILATTGRLCAFAAEDSAQPAGWCTYLPPSSTHEVGPISLDSSSGLVFRWNAGAPQATHGIWQVSVFPPPSEPALDFIGLRAFGDAPDTGGDFPIDLATVLYGLENPGEPASTSAASQPLQWGDLSAALNASPSASGSGSPVSAGQVTSVVPGGAAAEGSSGDGIPPVVLPAYPDALYVRAVSLAEPQQPLAASDPVKLLIDWNPIPKIKLPTGFSISGTITRPSRPNYDLQRCVRVIENPFGSANPVPDNLQAIDPAGVKKDLYTEFAPAPVGKTICAKYKEPEKPSFFGSLWGAITSAVDFVSKVWDAVADFVNDLKKGIIDFAAKFSGCEAIAEATGMSKEEAEATCVGGLTIAANAALAAYGIPPTVPKFDAVVSAAKGEVREAIKKSVREAAKTAGLDCDETGVFSANCDELVDKEMNDALDAIEEQVSKATVASAGSGKGWYLDLNPEIKVIPEPAGTLQGPVFDITITKAQYSNVKGPESCTVSAWATGTIHNYSWWDYEQGQQRSGETVSGNVFETAKTTIDLSEMTPGEPRSFSLALKQVVPWYPPGSSDHFWEPATTKGGKATMVHTGEEPHTWDFFGPKAEIKTQVDTCVGSVTLTWPENGLPTQPQDIVTQQGLVLAP